MKWDYLYMIWCEVLVHISDLYLPLGVVTVVSVYGSWFKPSSTTNRIWNTRYSDINDNLNFLIELIEFVNTCTTFDLFWFSGISSFSLRSSEISHTTDGTDHTLAFQARGCSFIVSMDVERFQFQKWQINPPPPPKKKEWQQRNCKNLKAACIIMTRSLLLYTVVPWDLQHWSFRQ